MIFLTGERIVIRSVLQKDADSMFFYRNDPVCSKYQRGQLKKKEEISALIARMEGRALFSAKRILLAIADKESSDIIGELSVLYDNGCVTLGYTIAPDKQRQGYAYEAISLFLDAHFKRFPIVCVICRVLPENEASIALLRKLGFDNCGYSNESDSLIFKKTKISNTRR